MKSKNKFNFGGPYKMGWIVVMFDLPVMTDIEKKTATKFRKDLLKDGYRMMQYSIYMRHCSSYDRMQKHTERLKRVIPSGGNVKAMFITDKQWEKSVSMVGKDYYSGKKRTEDEHQLSMSEFW